MSEVLQAIKTVLADNETVTVPFAYAVATVESNCTPFKNNFPIVRFEKHKFLNYLKDDKDLLARAVLLKGSNFLTFTQAESIDKKAAMLSTSFGMFQIMGFNYRVCGYSTVNEFVKAMGISIENQVIAFANFIANNKALTDAVVNLNFQSFARLYNGPKYEENKYDVKLKKAYEGALKLC